MNRSELNKDLFSNIEISNNVKKELYENCKKGKRAGDIRFRYATALTALIGVIVFGCTGIGAAAYYQSVQMRMEAMPETEIQEYALDLETDTSVTIDGAYSRKLTNLENIRVAELERKYNAEGLFPEEDVKRVATLAEWDGKSVCYVEEDHKLHLPDELTDEQILTFIDYQTKKDYVMEEEAEEDAGDSPSPYMDVTDISEDKLIELAQKDLKYLFKNATFDGWESEVSAFKPSAVDPKEGTSHDMYFVYFRPIGGSTYSQRYVADYNANDLSLIAVAHDGKENWATLKSYSDAEAAERLVADRAKVLSTVKALYGYDNPDKEWSEVYYDYTDPGENDVRQNRYVFTYGGTEVDVMWNIGSEEIASLEFFND
ncbi:MAG: hypothetical protein IK068_02070 [Lachnospiraceae bacterium]|nr:hypothetical protein [Lachnospiraceae bacterium]